MQSVKLNKNYFCNTTSFVPFLQKDKTNLIKHFKIYLTNASNEIYAVKQYDLNTQNKTFQNRSHFPFNFYTK